MKVLRSNKWHMFYNPSLHVTNLLWLHVYLEGMTTSITSLIKLVKFSIFLVLKLWGNAFQMLSHRKFGTNIASYLDPITASMELVYTWRRGVGIARRVPVRDVYIHRPQWGLDVSNILQVFIHGLGTQNEVWKHMQPRKVDKSPVFISSPHLFLFHPQQ